jgi:CubicO group peptidase (beta-lactamase class C family)
MNAAPERSTELDGLVFDLVVSSGAAPGATVALAISDSNVQLSAIGAAGSLTRMPGAAPVTPATPYDLASLTKPFFVTTVARLVRSGVLTLSAPLGDLLVEARGTPSEASSLELLLAHRAGLEAHRPFFRKLVQRRPLDRASVLVEACSARRPECRGPLPLDGFAPLYSDLGFLLAGAAIERLTQQPLDELIHEQVSAPLGLDVGSVRRWLARDRSFPERVAPTESVGWRGGMLRAVVHDENAWALSGHGAAGHAGLFGTAASVLELGRALLDAHAELEPFVRPRSGGSLRAGFDAKSDQGSAAGTCAGPRTFGHLGFTGTSLWCDPDQAIVSVLLSNRVCPTRDDIRLRAVRPRVQDALYAIAARWRNGASA